MIAHGIRRGLLIGYIVAAPALAQTPSAERDAAAYVARIAKIDRAGPRLNSVLTLNPDWRAQARALDGQAPLGPLHGKAILIKDNI
jgi:amidase